MKKPILLIMAAGLGSRYGGLKQMDPIGPNGELILDYSLFDAKRAGFEHAVLIIKRENEQDFKDVLEKRIGNHMQITYAYQDMTHIPAGFGIPSGRIKPWGTGHAVLCASSVVDAPFCAINADDFYGAEAFRLCYNHLSSLKCESDVAMVGYLLKNTLSETGSVARGVCDVTEMGKLTALEEQTHIISTVDGPLMTSDEQTYQKLSPDTIVSMNMWGFPLSMMKYLEQGFPAFLEEALRKNPLKGEYFLPNVVDAQRHAGNVTVRVHTTTDRWHGVTYQEDRPLVKAALESLTNRGIYPTPLW